MKNAISIARFRLNVLVLCLGSLIPLVWATISTGQTEGKRYAVIVGIEDYEHENLRTPPLKYSVDDAEALNTVLSGAGYETILLTDNTGTDDETLIPTKANIDTQITQVLEGCRRRVAEFQITRENQRPRMTSELTNQQHHTKTCDVGTARGPAAVTVRRTTVRCAADPRPAAQNTRRTRSGACRIADGRLVIIGSTVPVIAPFNHIPMHVL